MTNYVYACISCGYQLPPGVESSNKCPSCGEDSLYVHPQLCTRGCGREAEFYPAGWCGICGWNPEECDG